MTVKLSEYTGQKIDTDVDRVSEKLGDLIDDKVTERVHKSTIKNPNLKI